MIVVDASALLDALLGEDGERSRGRLVEDGDLHAPHLLDLEVLQVLRRLAQRGHITAGRAAEARADAAELVIQRYPHAPLADRIWELRANATAYDAAYLALAEVLAVPLVTCDARLKATPGHRAVIQVIA